jgi:hypothetical protein
MVGMSGMLGVLCMWEVGVRITTGHLQIQIFLVAVSYMLLCFLASPYCRVVVTTSGSCSGALGLDHRPRDKPSLLNFFVILLSLYIQMLFKAGHCCFYYLSFLVNISQLSLFFVVEERR